MHTKYGYVPNARKKICSFGNELLPKFSDSFRDPYSQSSGRPRRPKHRMDDQNNLNTRPLDE